MIKDFLASKFGRSVVAFAAGACATAAPQLLMGDVHAARITLASSVGGLCALIALHFKSEGAS
jgi:hypothetical protein